MRRLILALLALSAPLKLAPEVWAKSESVIRIEVGAGYDKYSNEELRRRVWMLERAVYQLQSRVFQLEVGGATPATKPWTCHLQVFMKTFTATETTKAAAVAKILKECSAASSAIHCQDDEVKCSNE